MSNDFDSESLNLGVQPVQYYVDNDGSLKFISEYISSSNFNGTIPVVSTTISASSIVPGMYISVTGSGVNSQYYPVVSISVDDPELEDTPSQSMTVTYIDGENIAENIYLDQLDLVDVKYENWDEKDLGTSGWGITSGGNAIFSNVAVRGRIEATEGEISGDLAIVDGGQIYVGNNKDSGQRINIRHTDLTGYSELGFPIFSLVTGSAVSASPILKSGGFDDLTAGVDADPPWAAFWGFYPDNAVAIVDSTFYKEGGQSLRLSLPPGDFAVEQSLVNNQLIPGEEYTITAWVYSASNLFVQNKSYVDIWLLTASTTAGARPNYFVSDTSIRSLIGSTSVPAGVWTKLTNKFTAPTSPNIYNRIDLRTHTTASTVIWWDSIEISKLSQSSKISGFYFNDGELYTDYLSIVSDGNVTLGSIKQNVSTSGNPDPTDIPDILKMSGTDGTYRLWVGHVDPIRAGFNVTKTGHLKSGLITSSATYNRTDTTAYVSISSGGVFGRYSSTQKIKNDIIPINNLLSSKIDESKIISGSPTINYKNILSLTPVEYSLIDYPENKKFGFLAEDVADKLPEIATYDDDGPTYFDLAGLLAATLSIVQEQQKTIEDLENRVIQLESKIGG